MEDANLKLEDSHEWVFNKAVAISRGVASLREYARKLEEIARDHLQRPRRKATKDNDSGGYSR